MRMIRSAIMGIGSALPARIMTNADMAKIVDTSDEWIVERTGIKARHIAAEGETTRTLAVAAALKALAHANMTAAQIDLIIVATSTPDNTFPATATMVQADLGITKGAAFDVQAVCSGFVFALTTADALLKAGQFKTALVIGAETFSRILDWTDRATCVLFGDGAGAVVLQAIEGGGTNDDTGILASKIHSDGRYHNKLYVDGGVSTTKSIGHLRMEGREVFLQACGVCHTDLHAARGDWPVKPAPPFIPGHEGIGLVAAVVLFFNSFVLLIPVRQVAACPPLLSSTLSLILSPSRLPTYGRNMKSSTGSRATDSGSDSMVLDAPLLGAALLGSSSTPLLSSFIPILCKLSDLIAISLPFTCSFSCSCPFQFPFSTPFLLFMELTRL